MQKETFELVLILVVITKIFILYKYDAIIDFILYICQLIVKNSIITNYIYGKEHTRIDRKDVSGWSREGATKRLHARRLMPWLLLLRSQLLS